MPIDSNFSSIELAVYPNFKKKPTNLKFYFFNSKGEYKFTSQKTIKIADAIKKVNYIDLLELIKKENKQLNFGHCKVIMNGNGYVPTRMKFGLNFSNIKDDKNLPSNICFNASVPNEKICQKPKSFRWCAVFSLKNQSIYLINSSFVKKYSKKALVKAKLWREVDQNYVELNFRIPANGIINIFKNLDKKIIKFLKNDIGWITFDCDSPFVSGFYVTDFKKGVIGADHLY